jgi:hypothetical protein
MIPYRYQYLLPTTVQRKLVVCCSHSSAAHPNCTVPSHRTVRYRTYFHCSNAHSFAIVHHSTPQRMERISPTTQRLKRISPTTQRLKRLKWPNEVVMTTTQRLPRPNEAVEAQEFFPATARTTITEPSRWTRTLGVSAVQSSEQTWICTNTSVNT